MVFHRTYNFEIWLYEGNEIWGDDRLHTLTDCSFRLGDVGKLNDAHSLGASAFKQNLSKLDLAGGFEELDEILVGS